MSIMAFRDRYYKTGRDPDSETYLGERQILGWFDTEREAKEHCWNDHTFCDYEGWHHWIRPSGGGEVIELSADDEFFEFKHKQDEKEAVA